MVMPVMKPLMSRWRMVAWRASGRMARIWPFSSYCRGAGPRLQAARAASSATATADFGDISLNLATFAATGHGDAEARSFPALARSKPPPDVEIHSVSQCLLRGALG